jgi:LPXTG-motif cell wall-anchored protein
MSLTRRLAAAIPAAGIAAFAALAFGGSPASASTIDHAAAQPAVMVTPSCPDARSHCGYGYGNTTPPGGVHGTTTPTRGHPGYVSPSTVPPTTPTAHVDTVPPTAATTQPGGVSPTTVPPGTPGGVSAGELPLTGASAGATMGAGGLLVAAGAAAIWYTRRRRTA